MQPGDSFATGGDFTHITAGWQKKDGSWTFNENDPDFDDDADAQRAKAEVGRNTESSNRRKMGGMP